MTLYDTPLYKARRKVKDIEWVLNEWSIDEYTSPLELFERFEELRMARESLRKLELVQDDPEHICSVTGKPCKCHGHECKVDEK